MNLPNALPVQSRVHARLGSNDIGNGRIVDIDQRNRPVEDWLYTVLLDSPGENQSRYTAFYRDELTLLAAPNTTHALWTTP